MHNFNILFMAFYSASSGRIMRHQAKPHMDVSSAVGVKHGSAWAGSGQKAGEVSAAFITQARSIKIIRFTFSPTWQCLIALDKVQSF